MKKGSKTGELREEYDFSQMQGGVRGKYAAAYRRGVQLVRLGSNVAESVNERSTGGRSDVELEKE